MILLAGHLAQMAVWTLAFVATGEFGTFAPAFYHSAVNYTTLGYGLVVSPRWRLLGPLEATSGTLAFGWSTAVSSPWSSGWRGFVIAFSSDGKADHES